MLARGRPQTSQPCKPPRNPSRGVQPRGINQDALMNGLYPVDTTTTGSSSSYDGNGFVQGNQPRQTYNQLRPGYRQDQEDYPVTRQVLPHYRGPSTGSNVGGGNPAHSRRPSYGATSNAGSDYGFAQHSPMRSGHWMPGNMTPHQSNSTPSWANQSFGDVQLECVDCSLFIGRGGALIFFFLVFGVRHRMKVLPADTDFRQRKELLKLKKGGLPLPQWPVCYYNNQAMVEPNAILRFLATRLGLYGQNPDPTVDYRADMTLDKLAYWRDHLSNLIGEHPEFVITTNNCDSPGIDQYLKITRKSFFHEFETLLLSSDSAFFLGDTVSWIDPVIYSVLFEDQTFVWSVVVDRKRIRESAMRRSSRLDEAQQGERTWRDMSASEFERECREHEEAISLYPRCRAFMRDLVTQSPVLRRWVAEHRNLWCSAKPSVTERSGNSEDFSGYVSGSEQPSVPMYPCSN